MAISTVLLAMFTVHKNEVLKVLGFWSYMAFQTIIRRQIFADFAIFIYRTFISHEKMFRYFIEYGVDFMENRVDDTGTYMASYAGGFSMVGCTPCIIGILHLMTASAK
jgi:hypothetical protein